MYYNLKLNAERELINSIDSGKVLELIRNSHGDPSAGLDDMVVVFVRDIRRFKEAGDALKLSRLELLLYCVRIAPEAFNYHLLRFIKENYNFELDARTYL